MNSPTPPVADVLTRLRERCCVNAYGLGTAFKDPLSQDAAKVIEALRTDLQRAREALEPFARIADRGKHGGRFIIASATYALANGKLDATPRESHWHWDDFERARATLNTISFGP